MPVSPWTHWLAGRVLTMVVLNVCYKVFSVTVTVSNRGTCSFSAHAVIRKWILLSDPEDKMAGAKVIENSS